MRIYLDNAATTPLSREVFLAMEPYIFENFGNPSSSHYHGKKARTAIEQSRRTISELLNTTPEHIIFTSCGTEADNTAILSSVLKLGVKTVITSRFEHHAVLNTLKKLRQQNKIELIFLNHDDKGNLSLPHLESLLNIHRNVLVSVMHGNNEIGNLNDIEAIAEVCSKYQAVFHSDTVQTMGYQKYDTRTLEADFLVGSAHKFHGPKGVGFLYSRFPDQVEALINGGAQEKSYRSGTENVTGIVGLAKALELSYANHSYYETHIRKLKARMIEKLKIKIPNIRFNGNSAHPEGSVSKILSVLIPELGTDDSVLDYLDQHQICASGGSACSSHSTSGSHVLSALGGTDGDTIRFSFSRYNTEEEIDYAVDRLAGFVKSGRNVLYKSFREVAGA